MTHPVVAGIDAVVAALSAAPSLTGVQVWDGPSAQWPRGDRIDVGTSGDGPGADVSWSSGGLGDRQASVDVHCIAMSWTGDTTVGPRRVRVCELVDAVRAELRRDRSLGGVVTHAAVSAESYVPLLAERGVMATVEFTVHLAAFR